MLLRLQLFDKKKSHNPSEIILIFWFGAQEAFQIIIDAETICAASYFLWKPW